jgi:hypothetical protein
MDPITLTAFIETLVAADAARFMDKYTKVARTSPNTYGLLNTQEKWQQLFEQVIECDMLCTQGCNGVSKPRFLACENVAVGCVIMTAGKK